MKAIEVMSKEPVCASPEQRLGEAYELLKEHNYNAFPVVKERKLVGFITASEMALQSPDTKVDEVMQTRVIAAPPDMTLEAIARLMFREGVRNVPIIEEDATLLGMITNTDIVRAHIERVTPKKAESMRTVIENRYSMNVKLSEVELEVSKLRPTQEKVYVDELRAREYEIKKGLAEPLLVIENGDHYVLVDGHHRVIAALGLGVEKLNCYLLKMERETELGLEKTAAKLGLHTLKDIKIIDQLSPYTMPLVVENGEVRKLV